MNYSLNKWRIYCNTEQGWGYKWAEEGVTPSIACFNDPNHEVNVNSMSIIDTIKPNSVFVEEEFVKTQGRFKTKGYSFTIPANSTYTTTISRNYDINLLSVWLLINDNNINDTFTGYVTPHINGAITSNVSTGNILNVDATSLVIANIGFYLQIKRASDDHIQELGEIIDIDRVNNTITVENEITDSFVTGDSLIFKIVGVDNIPLAVTGRHILGLSKIGSSFIDKRYTLTVSYTNNNNVDVKFGFELEYMY